MVDTENNDEDTLFIERGHLDELGIIDIANWQENHKDERGKVSEAPKIPQHLEELLKKMKKD